VVEDGISVSRCDMAGDDFAREPRRE